MYKRSTLSSLLTFGCDFARKFSTGSSNITTWSCLRERSIRLKADIQKTKVSKPFIQKRYWPRISTNFVQGTDEVSSHETSLIYEIENYVSLPFQLLRSEFKSSLELITSNKHMIIRLLPFIKQMHHFVDNFFKTPLFEIKYYSTTISVSIIAKIILSILIFSKIEFHEENGLLRKFIVYLEKLNFLMNYIKRVGDQGLRFLFAKLSRVGN
ncbi:hypothetical protein BpHYR1_013844 [Brachionus plicatilis]|uniref:Uncharacterized protein n=1 Tax=Brachionus plicatilis TaxID=10195 RepID=A0A3M7QBX2_BRAPC|nr:hypothetical protein BpHYR1_013844 [Brachionus plicatilis]